MGNHYTRFLEKEHTPESFVRHALAMTERDLREIALLAFSEWCETDIVSIELYQNIASLQFPSYGTWNGLLTTLRKLRRTNLQNGDVLTRKKIENCLFLREIVSILEQRIVDIDLKKSFDPLFRKVNFNQGKKLSLQQLLVIPITLRNLINHDSPTANEFWKDTAKYLRPLVEWLSQQTTLIELCASAKHNSPWFLEKDSELLTFNGIDRNFDSIYVTKSTTYYLNKPTSDILLIFQKLLGKTAIQEKNFVRWLTQMAPDSVKGVKMGDYLVGKVVGEGGHGRVHQGIQLSTGRKVAIKILRDGLVDEGDNRLRFEQEAIFLSNFSHPNIISLISHGEDAWSAPSQVSLNNESWYKIFKKGFKIKHYIVLEWIQGKTLNQYYKDSGYNNDQLIQWFLSATEALETVHQAGLVHRDVKPSNMMITGDGTLKLMDFGIARSAQQDRSYQTPTGVNLGTQAYMSPEQIRSNNLEAMVGSSSDIYSLCSVFYELYTKQRLFNHDQLPPKTVEAKKLTGERPLGERKNKKKLPWELQTILGGGLEPEPSDRYKSMKALNIDLLHFYNNEPITYKKPSLFRRIQLIYRRNKITVQISSILILLLITVTVIYLFSLKKERDEVKHNFGLALKEKLSQSLQEKNFNAAKLLSAHALQYLKKKSGDSQYAQEALDTSIVSPIILTRKIYDIPKEDDKGRGGIAFSADGKIFALISESGIELRDATTGYTIKTLTEMPSNLIYINKGTAKFSKDSKYLATSHSESDPGSIEPAVEVIKIWNLETNKYETKIKLSGNETIKDFIFHPNDPEKIIINSTKKGCNPIIKLNVWSINKNKIVETISTELDKTACIKLEELGTDADNRIVGIIKSNNKVILYDFSNNSTQLSIPYKDNDEYYLSPKSRMVVRKTKTKGSIYYSVILHTKSSKHLQQKIDCGSKSDHIKAIRFSPNSKYIAVSYFYRNIHKIDICNTDNGKLINSLYTHSGDNNSHELETSLITFHPDSNKILSINSKDMVLQLWDINLRRNFTSIALKEDRKIEQSSSIIFSPNGKNFTIVSKVNNDKTNIYMFDMLSGKLIYQYTELDRYTSFNYDEDSNPILLTFSPIDKGIVLLPNKLQTISSHYQLAAPSKLSNITLANNAKYLAIADSKNTISLWDRKTGKKLHKLTIGLGLEDSQYSLLKVKFSPDNRIMLVRGDQTNKFELWDVEKGRKINSELLSIDIANIIFSYDGKYLLATLKDSSQDVARWDITLKKDTIKILSSNKQNIYRDKYKRSSHDILALSQDGLMLAYTYKIDNSSIYIKIRNLLESKDIATFNGNFNQVTELKFSPDNSALVAITQELGNKRVITKWDITSLNTRKIEETNISNIETRTNLKLDGYIVSPSKLNKANRSSK